MCFICLRNFEFSFEHMEKEIAKLNQQERIDHAQDLKTMVKFFEKIVENSGNSAWTPEQAKVQLEYRKTAQYLLSRYM